MPRIRPRDVPFVKIKRLLIGYGLNGPALAEVLDCTPNTARSRLERPETLTLAELELVSRKGHVPMDEIRAAIIR